jgi:hypothetical protein
MRKISAPLVLAVALLGCGGGGGNPYHFDFTLYLGIAAGDLNGDGRNDLVMTGKSAVTVLLQVPTGGGDFEGGTKYPVGSGPEPVEIGDLNHDNMPDLVTASHDSDTVSVLLQDPAQPGVFQSSIDFGTGNYPEGLAIGDLNDDGFPDIAVGGSYLTLLFNNPADPGNFYTGGTFTVVSYFSSVAIADLDGDGRNDLAVTGDGVVTVLLQEATPLPAGSFSVDGTYAAGPDPIDVAVADLDADGKGDMAVANYGTSDNHDNANVSVLLQEHDAALRGAFQTAVNYQTGSGSYDVAIGDLNNDGKPDLAVVNESSISVLLQSAIPGVFLSSNNLKAHTPWRAAIADLNQDGLNDLAVAEYNGAGVYFQNPSVPGTFEPSLLVRP